ncbi:MAG: cupin domain-containing protein [Verrucomicrobia bacterium]|nr:cupin domain-containing protein [Verrucomicrobiota bacterium]MCH8511070.1 cupin domain-containing protein [Kiritimatiellia bacterium]
MHNSPLETWIKTFTSHPEGGRFRELWRSPQGVKTDDGRDRSALTHIHFHLAYGEFSRFHRVAQDEVWNLYHGRLCLWMLTEDGDLTRTELTPATATFSAVVPAGVWQAAEPMEDEALVGCSVAPGFDFADFTLISETHPVRTQVIRHGLDRFL